MQLAELIEGTAVEEVSGDLSVNICALAYDSRHAGAGTLYFCVRGETADGHDFAGSVVDTGGAGIVVERFLDLPVAQVRVTDARAAMAPLAARFYGEPTDELAVAGITGTNGKTTTAFLLREILEVAGRQTGLLGTVKQVVGGADAEVERTTPEAIDLQGTFRGMLDAGDVACVMEVSSHALILHRADAISFAVALFTNLTQDHLDFHADMEDYFAAKRLLFKSGPGASVVNVDDPFGRRLAADIDCVTFSAEGAQADFVASNVEFNVAGATFAVRGPDGDEVAVRTGLPGHFNVANALGAIAAGVCLGVSLDVAGGALQKAGRVPGRFEPLDEGQAFAVLVDYAHTPDSLENVLRAARRLTSGRVISVFGAGGDRDRTKRPLMGRAGAEGSDLAIVTSDNPRSESPDAIIGEILAGIDEPAGVKVEADRRAAIALALGQAREGDTVVIAGKGHEQGQEFEGGRKIPFDDREVAGAELRALVKAAAGGSQGVAR